MVSPGRTRSNPGRPRHVLRGDEVDARTARADDQPQRSRTAKFVGVYASSATPNDVIVVLKEGGLQGTAGEKTFPLAPVSPVRFRIEGMTGKNYLEFLPQDDAVNQVRVEIQGITPVLMDRKE